MIYNRLGMIVLATGLGLAMAQENVLSAAEKAAGFELMYDGVTVNPALLMNMVGGALNWQKDGDGLRCQSQGEAQSLCTKKKYANFEFHIDFKPGNATQNSGIFTRVPTATPDNIMHVPEYGIQGEPHTCGYQCHTGDVYAMQAASKTPQKMGEYNNAVIWMNGNYGEYWLDDIKVNEFIINSPLWDQQQIASTKINPYAPDYGDSPDGFVCVQDHGTTLTKDFWARNIKVREFAKDGKMPLPVATTKTLTTQPKSVELTLSVGVVGAVIRYTTDGTVPDSMSTIYTAPITFTSDKTVTVRAFRARFTPSDAVTAQIQGATAIISLRPTHLAQLFNRSEAGDLHFQLPDYLKGDVRLTDMRGSLVAEKKDASGSFQMGASSMHPGVYFLSFASTGLQLTEKILVE